MTTPSSWPDSAKKVKVCSDCEHCIRTCWLGRALCGFDRTDPEWTSNSHAQNCTDYSPKKKGG